jgi:hypothetical protein
LVSRADDALLVIVAVVGALILLKLFGTIVSTVWFFAKLAAVAALVFFVVRLVRNRGR